VLTDLGEGGTVREVGVGGAVVVDVFGEFGDGAVAGVAVRALVWVHFYCK
jgi:hypothetical protein